MWRRLTQLSLGDMVPFLPVIRSLVAWLPEFDIGSWYRQSAAVRLCSSACPDDNGEVS